MKRLDCRLKINKNKKSCKIKSKKVNKKSNKKVNKKSNKKVNKKVNNKSNKKVNNKSKKKVINKCFADKVVIKKSNKAEKKYMALFTNDKLKKTKTIHFGADGMSDYTIHKDKDRMNRYLNRHRKRENWEQCDTAGALSRWILWNKPTLQGSIQDYKKKFNLK